MFQRIFSFHKERKEEGVIRVSAGDLYNPAKGFGFVTEQNRGQQEGLQIPEINSGFEPLYWLKGKTMSILKNTDDGVYMDGHNIPLIFKADVYGQGNYRIKAAITAGSKEPKDIIVFAGRRRLIVKKDSVPFNKEIIAETVVNLCEIIPRGKTEPYIENSIDLAILGDNAILSELIIEEIQCPTIYVAGDSTVTDQCCSYPYDPGCSYCGWAQMLPFYLKPEIAVSNHAHSGLTTESFREEGHYAVVEKQIKPGDYFFLQFGHNDQKLPHLAAESGYAEKIYDYIKEIRGKKANPIIVTPLARNTWRGNGTYNDLLADYAKVCKDIGKRLQVPVIDLHKESMEFVINKGLDSAARYYFPKDYTHSNDYGGFLMAGFVAKACREISTLGNYLKYGNNPDMISASHRVNDEPDWVPPLKINLLEPPADFKGENNNIFSVKFNDIDQCAGYSAIVFLTENGIISDTSDKFRPKDLITRVETLDWVVKGVRFVPTNVYNDRFPDVIGHEWYAGIVETACQNDIINKALTADGLLHPLNTLTMEQLISFCMVSYRCRKIIKPGIPFSDISSVSSWAKEDIDTAAFLKFLPDHFDPLKKVTREEAAIYITKLMNML